MDCRRPCSVGALSPARPGASGSVGGAKAAFEMPAPLRCAAALKGHKGSVLAVTFNSDGNYTLSGGDDKHVLLWNPRRDEAEIASIKE